MIEPRGVADIHLTTVLRTERAQRGMTRCRLLEAGCGGGQLLAQLTDTATEAFGFDVSDVPTLHSHDFPAATIAHLHQVYPLQSPPWDERILAVRQGDRWPFADADMDVVVSNQVLEHVADHNAFFTETARVLRPGGFAVHLFPLRHYTIEGHTHMPLVHKLRSWDQRRTALRWLASRGHGDFESMHTAHGLDADEYATSRADFIEFDTNYLTWPRLAAIAKAVGLRPSYRYTTGLYASKAHLAFGRTPPETYKAQGRLLRDLIGFHLGKYVQGITLFLEKPRSPHAWRNEPGT
jgi:SAM-dependent methyltransferase